MSEHDVERLKERHREELKRERNKALEEAKNAIHQEAAAFKTSGLYREARTTTGLVGVVERIRSQPARRYLNAEEVRRALLDVLSHQRAAHHPDAFTALDLIGERLGLNLDAAPASGDSRPLWRWSHQQPQHAHLGDEDRRPDDAEDPREMATPSTCPKCGHAAHWAHGTDAKAPHSYCSQKASWGSPACGCSHVPPRREFATVENGLLPAPKLRPADLCAACGHTRRNHGDGCCNVYGDAIPNGCACTGFLEARR